MKAFLMGALAFLLSFSVFANWPLEQARIEFLLQTIEQSNATFIRNGSEYNAHEAADHLRQKLDMAIGGSSDEEKDSFTAELFIEKIASKSMLSGKPYYIRLNGQTFQAGPWLLEKLGNFHP